MLSFFLEECLHHAKKVRKSCDRGNEPKTLKFIMLMPRSLCSFQILIFRGEICNCSIFHRLSFFLLGGKHRFILFSAKRKRIYKSSRPEQCQQGAEVLAEK